MIFSYVFIYILYVFNKLHSQYYHYLSFNKILRWPCLHTHLLDHVTKDDIKEHIGVAPIQLKLPDARFWWYDHIMMRKADNSSLRMLMNYDSGRKRPSVSTRRQWIDSVNNDVVDVGVEVENVNDCRNWIRLSSGPHVEKTLRKRKKKRIICMMTTMIDTFNNVHWPCSIKVYF